MLHVYFPTKYSDYRVTLNLLDLFPFQRKHSDGQRRHARLPGRARRTPGSTQISRTGSRGIIVRAGQRRHGTRTRRRPDGMSQLFEMDGKFEVLDQQRKKRLVSLRAVTRSKRVLCYYPYYLFDHV